MSCGSIEGWNSHQHPNRRPYTAPLGFLHPRGPTTHDGHREGQESRTGPENPDRLGGNEWVGHT